MVRNKMPPSVSGPKASPIESNTTKHRNHKRDYPAQALLHLQMASSPSLRLLDASKLISQGAEAASPLRF